MRFLPLIFLHGGTMGTAAPFLNPIAAEAREPPRSQNLRRPLSCRAPGETAPPNPRRWSRRQLSPRRRAGSCCFTPMPVPFPSPSPRRICRLRLPEGVAFYLLLSETGVTERFKDHYSRRPAARSISVGIMLAFTSYRAGSRRDVSCARCFSFSISARCARRRGNPPCSGRRRRPGLPRCSSSPTSRSACRMATRWSGLRPR